MQFFISHSSSDHAWVEQLRKLIEQQGFIAYLAEQDHEPGVNLNAKLEAAVAASDAFVVLLTDTASTSGIVHAEIGYARALKKPIFPLVAPEVAQEPAALGMLNGLEYVLFDIADPQAGLLSLIEWAHKLAAAQRAAVLEAQLVDARTQVQMQAARVNQLELQRDAFALLVLIGVIAAIALLGGQESA